MLRLIKVLLLLLISTVAFAEKVTIIGTGDTVLHIPVKHYAKVNNKKDASGKTINNLGFDVLFKKVRHILRQADIAMTCHTNPIISPFFSRAFIFNSRPEILAAYKKAGINLINMATNHTYDFKYRGIRSTERYLYQHKLHYVGFGSNYKKAHKGHIYTKGKLKIGVLGYTGSFNANYNRRDKRFPHVSYYDYKTGVLKDIKRLKEKHKVDFVVLNVHFGGQYRTRPYRKHRNLTHLYMEAGADLVIGHGSHSMQYLERYKTKDGRNTFIAFGLGNFLSNMGWDHSFRPTRISGLVRDSIILKVTVEKTAGKTRITGYKCIPIWTENRWVVKNGRRMKIIRPIIIKEELANIDEELKTNPNRTRKIYLIRRKRLLESRLRVIWRILFPRGKGNIIKAGAK